MKRLGCLLSLVFVSYLLSASTLAAQDLVINNVRIIVGTGQVIEQGTILIKGGPILSAAAGIHFRGEIAVNSFTPDPKRLEAVGAAADEGKKGGVDVAVHAASVVAMNAAVKAGVPKLVHTPPFQWMTDADAQAVKAAGIQ